MADAPVERGTLDVRTKALQSIVEQTVLETPGTVRQQGVLRGVTSSTSPRSSVSVSGTGARVRVDVACTWPGPVAEIATEVRRRVLDRASELSSVRIISVDVTVHPVLDAAAEQKARVA